MLFAIITAQASISLPDTVKTSVNTLKTDTLKDGKNTTKSEKFDLKSKIKYNARDSIIMDMNKKMAWFYGAASIEYEEVKLKGDIISIDFNKNSINAFLAKDSTGKDVGEVEFIQGELATKSKGLSYNFGSKKGIIQNVITKEGEGYLHGSVVKRVNDSVTNIGDGEYTTCDFHEHPHFSIKYTRAKVLSGNKIITGPAYLSIADIPLPIAVPFGIFPNKKGRSSGLIIPRWGEAAKRGFYLENGGYYFGLSDNFDLKLTGDIYSRGSWAIKPIVSYYKRYKYRGAFNFSYATNIEGFKGSSDYVKSRDFKIAWSHSQDTKARPNSVFSASVQAGTSKYNKYNPTTVNDYVNNNLSSSISYDLRLGQFANFTASARHSQNISSHQISITLPEVAFGINRIYPFKRKVQVGKPRWYENIAASYSMNMRNELDSYDSLIFKSGFLSRFNTGMKHNIPVSGTFKVLKYFNWSNSFNFTERWYTKSINRIWINGSTTSDGKIIPGYVATDTIVGFKANRDYSFSSSLSTTLYGMKLFKKGPIKAIRHVARPSVGYSYVPDFGRLSLGYFRLVQKDNQGNYEKYSIYGGYGTFSPLYGTPPMSKSGAINFNVGNNLEMKVRSKKDTITGEKKVVLIDNLSLSTSYDLTRDSLRWSNLYISGYTTLFKKIQLNYSGSFSPYAVDSTGRTINKFEYQVSKKLLRFTNADWSFSLSYDLRPKNNDKKNKASVPPGTPEGELNDLRDNPDHYIDWDNPWSLHFDYNFRYGSIPDYRTMTRIRTVTQTLNLSGDISITDKWKFSARTGFDFETKKLTYTSLNIMRDLHCWEMRFNWIPTGYLKSWNFELRVKSTLLQDLKLTKKKDFRDNL